MRHGHLLKGIAGVLMYLVLTIPVMAASDLAKASSFTSEVLEEYARAYEQATGITGAAVFGKQSNYTQPSAFQNPPGFGSPAEACLDKKHKGESLVKFLDSGPIRTLTAIVEIMFAICTLYQTISALLDNMLVIVKGVCLVAVCEEYGPTPMYGVCTAVERVVIGWKTVTLPISLICCFVNCGFIPWCSGHSCWDQFGQLGEATGGSKGSFLNPASDFNKRYEYFKGRGVQTEGLLNYKENTAALKKVYSDKSVMDIAYPEGIGESVLGAVKGNLRAKDNIYTAIACLCPTAILINLKKLKAIYQVYNCCVDQACASGGSTEACDRALSEQTCMYWEGSLLQTLVGLLMGVLSMLLSKIITALIKKYLTFLIPILNCLTSVYELLQIPSNIKQLGETWEELRSAEFGRVSCDEIDTSAIGQFQPNLRERFEQTEIFRLNLEDWQRRKQEAENANFDALQSVAPASLVSLPLETTGQQRPRPTPDVARAPPIEFPRRRIQQPVSTPTPAQEQSQNNRQDSVESTQGQEASGGSAS